MPRHNVEVQEQPLFIRIFDHSTHDRTDTTANGEEIFIEHDGTRTLMIGANAHSAQDDGLVTLLFASGRFGPIGGDWLFHVGLWTPAEFRDEFLAWYEIEHLPILLECPSWEGCRFVEQAVRNGYQFYALHQLADASALDSEQRKVSRSTPWFERLKANDWFDERFVRTLYRRVPRTGAG